MDTEMLATQLVHLEALYQIVMESDEPEIVRRALAALTSTEAGLDYIRLNPFTV